MAQVSVLAVPGHDGADEILLLSISTNDRIAKGGEERLSCIAALQLCGTGL